MAARAMAAASAGASFRQGRTGGRPVVVGYLAMVPGQVSCSGSCVDPHHHWFGLFQARSSALAFSPRGAAKPR